MHPRDDTTQHPATDDRTDKELLPSHQSAKLEFERLEERVTPSHFHGLAWDFEHHITPPHLFW